MKLKFLFNILLFTAMGLLLTSCLGNDDEPDYTEWREANAEYLTKAEAELLPDGQKRYTKIVPAWASSTYCLISWINDPAENAEKLSPIDNSTIQIKYEVNDIEGNRLNDSYSMHTHGEGIYQTTPSSMIIGMRAALPYMHIGDECNIVIPYTAGYGISQYGSIKPYSTLVFKVKLVAIPAYRVEDD